MLHIVLCEPEIPSNTGNIIRLCANTGAALHLIHPLGFQWDSAKLRRAGLDYYDWVGVQHYSSLQAFCEATAYTRLLAFSTKGQRFYHDMAYQPGDALLFGQETAGLPAHILHSFSPEHVLRQWCRLIEDLHGDAPSRPAEATTTVLRPSEAGQ